MSDATSIQVVRSFRFRLLPSKTQHQALVQILDSQRLLYNAALEERIDCYNKTGKSQTFFSQARSLTICRKHLPEMAAIGLNIQRATLKRLDETYRAFFRRLKKGAKGGYPRFRGKDRFHSFGFSEFHGILFDGKRLRVKGIASGLRLHIHRPMPTGEILSCVFKRGPKGWTVSFQVRYAETPLAMTGARIGIDLGLSSFAAFDNGAAIPAPQIARRAEREMRRRQRALARCKWGSARRRKVKGRVTRLHADIANARSTFLHQASAQIIRSNDLIAIENLNVQGMSGGIFARSISDVSWGKFCLNLAYKAESAGRLLIKVDAKNTTQACSGCGVIVPKDLSQRWHDCPECGLSLGRDHNAARNVLHKAVAGLEGHKLPIAGVGLRNLCLGNFPSIVATEATRVEAQSL